MEFEQWMRTLLTRKLIVWTADVRNQWMEEFPQFAEILNALPLASVTKTSRLQQLYNHEFLLHHPMAKLVFNLTERAGWSMETYTFLRDWAEGYKEHCVDVWETGTDTSKKVREGRMKRVAEFSETVMYVWHQHVDKEMQLDEWKVKFDISFALEWVKFDDLPKLRSSVAWLKDRPTADTLKALRSISVFEWLESWLPPFLYHHTQRWISPKPLYKRKRPFGDMECSFSNGDTA